jgi:hypothetical protein
MLRGDFGYSLQAGVPVSELIASNLPDTLSLALPAFALAVVLALHWLLLRACRVCAGSVIPFSLCRCCLSPADVLAGYRPNPALFIPVEMDPGH